MPAMVSRMASMPYVKGKNGCTIWNAGGIISMGYIPADPGICMISSTTAKALPMCLNVAAKA